MRPADPAELLRSLRSDLARAGDPGRAVGMAAYMKSDMPFHGVPAPGVRTVCRARFDGVGFPSERAFVAAVRGVWDGARFREERYAAITLSGTREAARFQTPRVLPLYEHLIVTGAWWDYVDEVAIRRVGPILRAFPGTMSPRMRAWGRSEDLWKRRTAIICQVGSGAAIDRGLLHDCIAPSLDSREFFLRKAIGWALRQDARIAPDSVRQYVASHVARLSALSRREALRHLQP